MEAAAQSALDAKTAEANLAPVNQSRNEIELGRRVRSFLEGRNIPGLRRVDVDVRGGRVMLHGRVRSFYEKQLAVHCCRRVAGVIDVVDSIDVSADTN